MPYDLRKARGKDLWYVITKATGKRHSNEPLPLARAVAQLKALYANAPDVGGAITTSDQLEISRSTYGNAKPTIGNAQLVKETKTLKFYKEGNNIIIGVRGTKDWTDWVSNFSLAVRNKSVFRATPRVTQDIADIKEFQKQYPPSQYHYSGVGHSLGGAVIDELIDSGLIKEGRSYNPAVHIEDIPKGVEKNKRVYEEADPLRALGLLIGQKQDDLDLRKDVTQSINPLDHHGIKNRAFEGGGKGQSKIITSKEPPPPEGVEHWDFQFQEAKGEPFMKVTITNAKGEHSFTNYQSPDAFEKSMDFKDVKERQPELYEWYMKRKEGFVKRWTQWRGGMMPYAEHKEKMRKIREENLAKKRALSNFSPIQVPPPPPPPPKSNRKIVFEGKGIQGKFHQQIIKAGMTPESYMRAVLKNAKANGYGEYTADIEFSDDDVHKLMIKTEIDGRSRTERFGRVGYGDFVLWNHSNPALAETKKDTFHRSHEAMKGKWRSDPLSPNNLSLHILW